MIIEKHKVVSFHYQLNEEGGEALENSHDGEPMAYLHGRRGIIPGLEQAMAGKQAGDKFTTTVAPEQAYGPRQERAVQRVPIKHLRSKSKKFQVGQIVMINTEQGRRDVRIVKVGKFNVDVDTNHPLAGKTLVFEIEVLDVRDATAEEIAHGHAHGAGGHQH